MARYTKAPDVHTLTREERMKLQPGQHITASGSKGRWAGTTPTSEVASWAHNHDHLRTLIDYARGRKATT